MNTRKINRNNFPILNFADKSSIEKNEVLRQFQAHETIREKRDDFAHDIIERLRNNNDLRYYKCKLSQSELENLALPWHEHDIGLIPKGGQILLSSCESFKKKEKNHPDSCCIKKVRLLQDKLFYKKDLDLNSSFILPSNEPEYVHPGQYNNFNKDTLFIANGFHRLLAIGLYYYDNNKFTPFDIYYAEKINVA